MLQLFDLEFWLSIGPLSLQFKIRYIFECCSFVDFQAKYWFYLIAFKLNIDPLSLQLKLKYILQLFEKLSTTIRNNKGKSRWTTQVVLIVTANFNL